MQYFYMVVSLQILIAKKFVPVFKIAEQNSKCQVK